MRRLSNLIEVVVYVLTLLYLDPFAVMVDELEFDPPCPQIFWEAGAMAIFLAWLNLLLYFRRCLSAAAAADLDVTYLGCLDFPVLGCML